MRPGFMLAALLGCGSEYRGVLPPENTKPPEIRGEARIGSELRIYPGEWTPEATELRFQWFRCHAQLESCGLVSSAAGIAYAPQAEDVGFRIRATVLGLNSAGFERVLTEMVGPILE